MPRPLRLHVPGALYHITLRGNHRQNIFFTPDDRQILNSIVAARASRGHPTIPRRKDTRIGTVPAEGSISEGYPVDSEMNWMVSRFPANRNLTIARAWIAHQAVTLRVASLLAIARRLARSASSLRESVKLHFDYP